MSTENQDWVRQELENGRYQITALLAPGGTSHVYWAWDTRLRTDVVIKVPHKDLIQDATVRARFMREVRALVNLTHPHIVRVLDSGEHEGLPFLVMQFLPGGSLHDRLRAGGDGRCRPVPLDKVRPWLLEVADAIDYIHTQGYVHRDVEPRNILFDSQGRAYLSDFGLAKALHGDGDYTGLTTNVPAILKPNYMAPEIGSNHGYDGRVDQYGLATTVYQCLCGRLPFEGFDAFVERAKQPPPLPNQLVTTIPSAVSAAVARALSIEPSQRFANCMEFARAVAEVATAPKSAAAPTMTTLPLEPAPAPVAKSTPVSTTSGIPVAPVEPPTRSGPPPQSVPAPSLAPAASALLPPAADPSVSTASSSVGNLGMTRVPCPKCQKMLKLPVAARKVKCGACGEVFYRQPEDIRRAAADTATDSAFRRTPNAAATGMTPPPAAAAPDPEKTLPSEPPTLQRSGVTAPPPAQSSGVATPPPAPPSARNAEAGGWSHGPDSTQVRRRNAGILVLMGVVVAIGALVGTIIYVVNR